jgi:hypothetical protein
MYYACENDGGCRKFVQHFGKRHMCLTCLGPLLCLFLRCCTFKVSTHARMLTLQNILCVQTLLCAAGSWKMQPRGTASSRSC